MPEFRWRVWKDSKHQTWHSWPAWTGMTVDFRREYIGPVYGSSFSSWREAMEHTQDLHWLYHEGWMP